MNQIRDDFLKGLKQLGQETGEKLVTETGKIAESIITAKELLGDIKPLSEEEMVKKQADDEKKKKEEEARLRQGYGGQERNVEGEVKQIRDQKKKEEEEKEKMFLENLKRQRQQEEKEKQEMMNAEAMMSSNKHKKDKGGNPHKKQQPDMDQMSQTSEFKGGKIN